MINIPTEAKDESEAQKFAVLQQLLGLPDAHEIAKDTQEQQRVIKRIFYAMQGTRKDLNELGVTGLLEGKLKIEREKNESRGIIDPVQNTQLTYATLAFQELGQTPFETVNRAMQKKELQIKLDGKIYQVDLREMLQACPDLGKLNLAELQEKVECSRVTGSLPELTSVDLSFFQTKVREVSSTSSLTTSEIKKILEELFKHLRRGPQEPLCPVVPGTVATDTANLAAFEGLASAKDSKRLFTAYTFLEKYPELILSLTPASSKDKLDLLRNQKAVAEALHHIEHGSPLTVPSKASTIAKNAKYSDLESELRSTEKLLSSDIAALDLANHGVAATPTVVAIPPNPRAADGLRRSIANFEAKKVALQELIGELEERAKYITHLAHALSKSVPKFDISVNATALHALIDSSDNCDIKNLCLNTDFKHIAKQVRDALPEDFKDADAYTADIRAETKRAGAPLKGDEACLYIIQEGLKKDGVPAALAEPVTGLLHTGLDENGDAMRQAEGLAAVKFPTSLSEGAASATFNRGREIPESKVEIGKSAALGGLLFSTSGKFAWQLIDKGLGAWGKGFGLLAGAGIGAAVGRWGGTWFRDKLLNKRGLIGYKKMTINTQDPRTAELIREWVPRICTIAGTALGVGLSSWAVGIAVATLLPTLATLGMAGFCHLLARTIFEKLIAPTMRAGGSSASAVERWRNIFVTALTVGGGLFGGFLTGGIGPLGVLVGGVIGGVARCFRPSSQASALVRYSQNVLQNIGIQETDAIESMEPDELKSKYFLLRLLSDPQQKSKCYGDPPTHPGQLVGPEIMRILRRMDAALVLHNARIQLAGAPGGVSTVAATGHKTALPDLISSANQGLESEYAQYSDDTGKIAHAKEFADSCYQEAGIADLHKTQVERAKTKSALQGSLMKWLGGGAKSTYWNSKSAKKGEAKDH